MKTKNMKKVQPFSGNLFLKKITALRELHLS